MHILAVLKYWVNAQIYSASTSLVFERSCFIKKNALNAGNNQYHDDFWINQLILNIHQNSNYSAGINKPLNFLPIYLVSHRHYHFLHMFGSKKSSLHWGIFGGNTTNVVTNNARKQKSLVTRKKKRHIEQYLTLKVNWYKFNTFIHPHSSKQ